jgi:hypothetical protein
VLVYREYQRCMEVGEEIPSETDNAMLSLAEAVRSAYRDDDAEVVLLERLVGLGWENIDDDEFPVYASPKSDHDDMSTRIFWCILEGERGWYVGEDFGRYEFIRQPVTLGHLRALCYGLGIKLKDEA